LLPPEYSLTGEWAAAPLAQMLGEKELEISGTAAASRPNGLAKLSRSASCGRAEWREDWCLPANGRGSGTTADN